MAWTEQCQASFEELKSRLTSAPVLVYADFSLPFILEVDTSHGGLGAVLSQEQGGKVRLAAVLGPLSAICQITALLS